MSSSSDDALARVQETLKKWNDYFEERDIPCLISVHCIRASLNALRGKKHGGDDIFDYTDVTDEIWLEFELGTIEKKTKQKYSSKKNRGHTRKNNGRTRKYQKRVSSSESEDEDSDFDSSESESESSSNNHKHSSSRKNRGRRYHKKHNRRHQKEVSSSSSNDHKHSSSKKVQKQSHTVEL